MLSEKKAVKDEVDKFIGKLVLWNSVKCGSENEIFLLNKLRDLLTIETEEKALEYVLGELKSIVGIEVVPDFKNFGVYAVIPSLKSSNQKGILMDSHIDTWKNMDFIQPEIFESSIHGKTKYLLKGTGIDNRIHCAMLLSMAKFCRFEQRPFIVLFSIEEERGFCGARYFASNIDLKKSHNITLDLIIVLDVCHGELFHNASKQREKKLAPVIGNGFCPIRQNFGEYENVPNDGKDDDCNAIEFKYKYRSVWKCLYSCPCCYMHEFCSYGSVSDVFDMYKYFSSRIEDLILKEKKNEGIRNEKFEELKRKKEDCSCNIRKFQSEKKDLKNQIEKLKKSSGSNIDIGELQRSLKGLEKKIARYLKNKKKIQEKILDFLQSKLL